MLFGTANNYSFYQIPNFVAPSTTFIPTLSQVLPKHAPIRAFCLKWISGTTVSKCYGCGSTIPNPPTKREEELVIVYRDFRQYRERNSGKLTTTPDIQNVHFHLSTYCVRIRYPTFSGVSVVIPSDFMSLLTKEHVDHIQAELGVTL